MRDIYDGFHRRLYSIIMEKLNTRMEELSNGGAPDYPSYCGQVAYIRALRDVLDISHDIDVDMYGGKTVSELSQEE